MSQTVEDALAQMQLENEQVQAPQEYTPQTPTAAIGSEPNIPAVKEYSAEIKLKVFRSINEYLGNLSDVLAEIDSAFEDEASVFYAHADMLASKRKLNDEDLTEIYSNLAAGAITQSFGSVISFAKTTAALSNVKAILKQEAERKLKYLQPLIDDSWGMAEVAYERFSAHYSEATFYMEDVANHFNELKMELYHYYLAVYAQNIYSNVLNGTLADSFRMPTLYDVNRLLYVEMTKSNPFEDNDFSYDALMSPKYKLTRMNEVMCSDIKGIEENLEGKDGISISAVVMAYDPQIMALAIHEAFSDDVRIDIANLYFTASAHDHTALGKALCNNHSLSELVDHSHNIMQNASEASKCSNLLTAVVIMMIVTGCMIAVSNSLAWYWCVACAIAGWLVGLMVVPFTKMEEKFKAKEKCIKTAITVGSKYNAGHRTYVDLGEMASSNALGWILGIVGLSIGCLGGPVGAIIGLCLGIWIADLISKKPQKLDTDYSKIKIKWGFKWTTILVLLIALNLLIACGLWL